MRWGSEQGLHTLSGAGVQLQLTRRHFVFRYHLYWALAVLAICSLCSVAALVMNSFGG